MRILRAMRPEIVVDLGAIRHNVRTLVRLMEDAPATGPGAQ